jgi:AcrR family transcriptional regulator
MTLTRKGLASKQRIIEGAAAHLRSDSPGRVTLDELRAATASSKSQLFHYFPGGKVELLLAVARHEADRVLADQQPHLQALTTWPAWDAWRRSVIARYASQGPHCPLSSLMNQVGNVPGAAQVAATLLEQWQGHVRRGIVWMQADGLIDPGIDPERASAAVIAGIQGGVAVLRSTGSTAHLEAAFDLMIDYLHREARLLTTTPTNIESAGHEMHSPPADRRTGC